MYDIAIIGGGPAGYSAAINAEVLNLNFIWFTGKAPSQKVIKAERVQNYLGLPEISGKNLSDAFDAHIDKMGVKKIPEIITGVYETGGFYTLIAGDKDYKAKTVIICTGVQTAKPVAGEEEFLGRGVSYCAVCDGNFYRGKDIAVLSFDIAFEHEIEYLCSLARTVKVMPMYKGCAIKAGNAEIILKSPTGFVGDSRVKKVLFKDGELNIDGVFVLRNCFSPSQLCRGLKAEGGHIAVNRALETNMRGVFAAGDCTGRPYQYIKSAGEGNIAIHSAAEYLAKALTKK